MSFINKIAEDGFAVVDNVVDTSTLELLASELARVQIDGLGSQRAGKAFGIRNLMNAVPGQENSQTAICCARL